MLYSEDDMVVMSGDVGCWCALFGTLVGVSVLSFICLEFKSISEISSPRRCLCMSTRVWSVRSHHM